MGLKESRVATLLSILKFRLSARSDTPSLDAQLLIAQAANRPRSWVMAHPETNLTPEQTQTLEMQLARLESGEPLPYVLGHWEFFGIDFFLTPQVLIPRPETELLVEQALKWLRDHTGARRTADVGTGSGCIAISLAVNVSNLKVFASDLSMAALQVARSNAQNQGVAGRVSFFQADLLTPLSPPPLDLICANLPYIPSATLRALPVYQAEPTLALDGGPLGLDSIHPLLQQASHLLAPESLLLLEIEASQGEAALALARQNFPQAEIQVHKDLAGRDRLVAIRSYA